MSPRRPRSTRSAFVLGVLVGLVFAAAALPVASVQAAGPEFGVTITHSPASFHRQENEGDSYTVEVTNTGDAPTSGLFTLTDTLPTGLTVAPRDREAQPPVSGFGECTGNGTAVLEGATVLACATTEPLAPGETTSVHLRVEVAFDAPDTVTNAATVSGGGAPTASAGDPTPVLAKIPFTVSNFAAPTTDESGNPYTVAGGHPFQNLNRFSFPDNDAGHPTEELKDAGVELPIGFFGNPAAAPRCPIGNILFGNPVLNNCPAGSEIGFALINGTGTGGNTLYNVKPDRGFPAQFVFLSPQLITLFVNPHARTESYGLTVAATNAPQAGLVHGFTVTFCSYAATGSSQSCGSPAGSPFAPFLTNPVDCSETHAAFTLAADSWETVGATLPSGFPDFSDPKWQTATAPAPAVTECNELKFEPTIATQPLPLQAGGPVQADQPSGLAVDLNFPQNNDPTDPGTTFDPSLPQTPEPKDLTVKLPPGLVISPSSAEGLGACSDLASDPAGDQVHYDTTKPVTCPDSSKIGTAVATSPLLGTHDPVTDEVNGAEPIPGSVYLLKPHPGDLVNGQDGKFRLLIQLENARYGINFKLPGVAVANRQTGQLTTVFTENPQLPAKHLTVSLKAGSRAPLATPVTCGKFTTTTTDLVPWSTPTTPDATPSAAFNVTQGPNGTACANTPAQRPFAPTITAGSESSKAGATTPFTLKLTRADGEQELSALETTMPPGFSAKLTGVPYCPEAAIAAAGAKSGAAEQASPSCPAASQIGTVTAGAGPGPTPFYTTGKAYLAGPYKSAPLSAVFITPAVAGPFDLGNVVVRAALQINPETAQVTVKTDQLPSILDGVPLRLRSITARIDRPDFTLNPTNCSPLKVSATVASTDGASASPSQSFQVGSCKSLAFKPGLSLALKGDTKRSGNPALTATLTYPKGGFYANIAQTTVLLPSSEFIDNAHINNPCTRVQFAANACPASSILGTAVAYTPLLEKPLEGPVYFRSNGGERELPDMVVDLNGQIHVDLVGFIDAVHKKGSEESRVRTRFLSVPDAPVSKFVLKLKGGKHGLIENSKNLCGKEVGPATVQLGAQNGLVDNFDTKLKTSCKKGKGKGKGHKHAKGSSARQALVALWGW